MLPVSISPWYTPSFPPSSSLLYHWKAAPAGRGGSAGSWLGGRDPGPAAGSWTWGCATETSQDLSSGEKARITGCALKFPPFCHIAGGQRVTQLQSPVCMVQLLRRGQRSEGSSRV